MKISSFPVATGEVHERSVDAVERQNIQRPFEQLLDERRGGRNTGGRGVVRLPVGQEVPYPRIDRLKFPVDGVVPQDLRRRNFDRVKDILVGKEKSVLGDEKVKTKVLRGIEQKNPADSRENHLADP